MNATALPASLTIRAVGDEPAILITTPARDLMHDTVDPIGMAIESYLNGTRAVHLFHDHGRLPVGKTLSLTKSPQGIVARFRWLDANPEARVVREVFEEGVLGASIEFVPVDVEPNRAGGLHYAKTVLTGWALTANPANPQCTRLMKSLGLTRDDEPVLVVREDADEQLTVEPQALVAAFRAVARQSRLGRADEPIVFRLVTEPAAEEETYLVDPDAVKAATEAYVKRMVDHQVKVAIDYLRGRVD